MLGPVRRRNEELHKPRERDAIIVSLLPALSITKYPSFEAKPQSSTTSNIAAERWEPSCSPSMSFKAKVWCSN